MSTRDGAKWAKSEAVDWIPHDRHLVEVPLSTWPGTKPTEVASESWPELDNPAPNRLIGQVEPAFGQELFHISVAQCEAEIEPDRVPDDFRWELMTGVGDGLHAPTLPRPILHVTRPPRLYRITS